MDKPLVPREPHIPQPRAQRLDQYVAEQFPGISRAFSAKLINEGKVTVNDAVMDKPGYKIRGSTKIDINYELTEPEAVPSITLDVLYEDNDCAVIVKPMGLLTHSKGAHNAEPTVATWLAERADMAGDRAGIVHRLDRATSGVMIVAKNTDALTFLQKQFSQRKAKKTYAAIVVGALAQPHALIDMPIERNPKMPQTFRVGTNGKPSQTEYEVIESNGEFSQLILRPTTGRTHQLRVHLAHLGHQIVGDTLYKGFAADRLYLHAASLEITLPNRERKTFEAPTPAAFKTFMEQ